MTLWEQRLDEFRDRVASRAPTPGGGSVACVCATFATGLLVMAAEITRASQASDELDQILSQANLLVVELSAHADRDVEAFQSYVAALALPRGSDEEKAARKQAIADAAVAASEAPLDAGETMADAIELTERAKPAVKPSVMSDVLAAQDLLRGAVAAVLRNVDINLPYVGDEKKRDLLESRKALIQLRALR
jgi:formiminotetrahydrofolate cyclodeaminase